MNKFAKAIAIAIATLALSTSAQAQGQRVHVFTTTGTDASISNIGSGIGYHMLTWNKTGTVTVCQVKLEQSADSISWSDLIVNQDCSTNGQSAVTHVVANYIRMNMTSFTGTGSVNVRWNGFITPPSGGGSVTSITATSPVTVTPNPITGVGDIECPGCSTSSNSIPVTNVKGAPYNAKGDSRSVTDGVTTSNTTVTSATAAFVAGDVGKGIWGFSANANGGGATRIATGTTITMVNSATNITISGAASATTSGVTLIIGTDDTASLVLAYTAVATKGTVYIPCGNYMTTSRIFNDNIAPGTRTQLNVQGEDYNCVNIWYARDFTYVADGLGQFIQQVSPGTISELTFDGQNNGPATTNKLLLRMAYPGEARDIQVKNWGASDGNNNACIQSASDDMVWWHPMTSQCPGGMFVQSLRTDVYFPELSGRDYALQFNEQGNRVFGGILGSEGNATHTLLLSNGLTEGDASVFGTQIGCSGAAGCYAVDLTGATAQVRLTSVHFGPQGGQPDVANTGGIKVASGATAYVAMSRLYARSGGSIYNNSGTIFDLGGNTINGNGTLLTGTAPTNTIANCSDSAGAAACGAASAGAFVVDAASTSTVVSTTAVTANSEISVQFASYLGTRLGITCNVVVSPPTVTSITAGTSFTVTVPSGPVTNPACFIYTILN